MTSINAMKFDRYSGLLICDEQRAWNDEMLRVNSCEKIRSVIRDDIRRDLGIAACYGNTGTTSVGDEFCNTLAARISLQFDEHVKSTGAGKGFMKSIEDIAQLGFQVQTDIKRKHIDEQLKGKFGFTANEFMQGKFKTGDQDIEIKDKEIIDTTMKWLTWESRSGEVTGVFLNAAVIAGYSPKDGFRIFFLSLIDPMCEPVGELFLAEGSGLDICELLWSQYANAKTIPERRGDIDKVEGAVAMIEGLNEASSVCVGVGGYLKLIYIDGRQADHTKRMKEISDMRSKLASEIVWAMSKRFIENSKGLLLVDDIIYKDRPFWEVNDQLMNAVADKDAFIRSLRGYHL